MSKPKPVRQRGQNQQLNRNNREAKANTTSTAKTALALVLLAVATGVLWNSRRAIVALFRPVEVEPHREQLDLSLFSESELVQLLEIPTEAQRSAPSSSFDLEGWTSRVDESLQDLRLHFPNDPQVEHLCGLAQLHLKRTKLAEPSLRRCVQLQPKNPQMRLDLADMLVQLGRDEEALEILKAGATDAAVPPEYLLAIGKCELRVGSLDSAKDFLVRALGQNPKLAQANLALADVLMQQREYDSALHHAQLAADEDPKQFEAWLLLSRLLSLTNKPAEADEARKQAQQLQQANQSEPGRFEAEHAESMRKLLASTLRSAAQLYAAHDQSELAAQQLNLALELDAENATALFDLSNLRRKLGDFESAAILTARLIALQPLELPHYHNLANLCMELNQPALAEAALRLACWRMPDNGTAQLGLAKFLLMSDRAVQAVQPAEQAVKLLQTAEAERVLAESQQSRH